MGSDAHHVDINSTSDGTVTDEVSLMASMMWLKRPNKRYIAPLTAILFSASVELQSAIGYKLRQLDIMD